MAQRYDAVIIGGGHNGLISAAYLARAGMRTLVLERRHVLGGAAVTEEIVPGFRFSVASYVVSLLRPEVIRELRLPEHGLDILPLDGTFTPLPAGSGAHTGGGDYLWRVNDHGRTVRELRRWSTSDAEAYEEYGQLMVEMARFIKPILGIVPGDPTDRDPRPLLPIAALARSFGRLTERQQAVFVQLMTMSAADFLDQWFETDPLKATMSASGIIGTYQGIRSPGTAYVLLHHYMGEIDGAFRAWGIPKGGTGGVSYAIARSAQALGAEIRTEAPVARIRTHGDRATGVVLADGEEIDASVVLSSADAKVTFLDLLAPGTLDASFEEEVRRFKFRGSSGKVNLAVDRLPDFTCLPGVGEHLRGAISFSPSMDDMERAYDDAKYGHWSRKPYIDMIIPTLVDPQMAPPGKHVISCFVQYAPYKLDPALGTWDDNREAFGDAVMDRIAEFAPNIRDITIGRQVLTPLDIERTMGLTEGNIFQGELSLEQLFFNRPVPGYARFRTPIRDLWLSGSSTHPGGGLMGANGRLAALEVLKSRGRKVA
ncbi:MAG: NAD(P)/FAD-dependent oxidoreductase [Chloroflexota bacterium]|nr:NAD(P)/FAD-dependent oxidoreductase [Chloroflexota bacterium]MDH5243018.1 NAD(P)/FAD-dependent oxidoreductase [Chloroflexota bacterium]